MLVIFAIALLLSMPWLNSVAYAVLGCFGVAPVFNCYVSGISNKIDLMGYFSNNFIFRLYIQY